MSNSSTDKWAYEASPALTAIVEGSYLPPNEDGSPAASTADKLLKGAPVPSAPSFKVTLTLASKEDYDYFLRLQAEAAKSQSTLAPGSCGILCSVLRKAKVTK